MEKELENISASPQVYEVGFHIIPTVAEGDLGVEVTAVSDAIDAAGGRRIADEYPKLIDLAYPMVKISSNKRTMYHSAHFGWMKFEIEPGRIHAIDGALKKNELIIRFILVKTVRENTMVPRKVFQQQKRIEETPRVVTKAAEKPVMTEEELDKTIEDLVIS